MRCPSTNSQGPRGRCSIEGHYGRRLLPQGSLGPSPSSPSYSGDTRMIAAPRPPKFFCSHAYRSASVSTSNRQGSSGSGNRKPFERGCAMRARRASPFCGRSTLASGCFVRPPLLEALLVGLKAGFVGLRRIDVDLGFRGRRWSFSAGRMRCSRACRMPRSPQFQQLLRASDAMRVGFRWKTQVAWRFIAGKEAVFQWCCCTVSRS